jgi:hypothetical protein
VRPLHLKIRRLGVQHFIQCRQRKATPVCKFKIAGVVNGQPKLVRNGQCVGPNLGQGIGVNFDGKLSQRCDGSRKLGRTDAAAAHGQTKTFPISIGHSIGTTAP